MSLREVQSQFARLVTDDAYRESLRHEAIGAENRNLPHRLAADAGVLAHAATLKRKRAGAAAVRLPLVRHVLADQFFEQFDQFAGAHTLSREQRYDRDALTFLTWLASRIPVDEQLKGIGPRLSQAIRINRHELTGRLRRAYIGIARVDGRQLPESARFPNGMCLCVWLRCPGSQSLRRFVLRMPFT